MVVNRSKASGVQIGKTIENTKRGRDQSIF